MGSATNRTIGTWLKRARITDDPAGDFIGDMRDDVNIPNFKTLGQMLSYLRSKNACYEAKEVAPIVWQRYQKWLATKNPPIALVASGSTNKPSTRAPAKQEESHHPKYESKISVPLRDPKEIEADIKSWGGDNEKVATAAVKQMGVLGVAIISRYGKAGELATMGEAIMGMPRNLLADIIQVDCDSKSGTYSMIIKRRKDANVIGLPFAEQLQKQGVYGAVNVGIKECDENAVHITANYW